LLELHFYHRHAARPFVSVSENAEVAIAIGRHFAKPARDKQFYLLQFEIPALDIVTFSDHAILIPELVRNHTQGSSDKSLHISVNGEPSAHLWDERVESFVFWKIDGSEVVAHTQPKVSESSWSNIVTDTIGHHRPTA